MTTPAGINPFTGDPNWQRVASYLIGPAANGITLDANGSLLLSASSTTYTGAAPISVNGSQISLTYLAPMYLNGTALAMAVASPLGITGSAITLSVTAPITTSGGTVELSYTTPLNVTGGQLGLAFDVPLYNSGGHLALKYSGNLRVVGGDTLDINFTVLDQTDSGEQTLGSGAFTWTGTTAPSSFNSAVYRWVQTGKLVSFFVRIWYNTNGSALTRVTFSLPGDCPTPALWSSQPNNSVIITGQGQLAADFAGDSIAVSTLNVNASNGSSLYVDGSGNLKFEIFSPHAANYLSGWGMLTYVAA